MIAIITSQVWLLVHSIEFWDLYNNLASKEC